MTFDRSWIRRRWKRSNFTPLDRVGGLVRKIARQSIRRGKLGGRPGPAGKPPKSRQPGAHPPFKMIRNTVNLLQTQAVVGMIGFGGARVPVPGIHELGLTARRWTFSKKLRPKRKGQKRVLNRAQKLAIRRAQIQSGNLAERSVKYPVRQFMRPALRQALHRLPSFWLNSFGGT